MLLYLLNLAPGKETIYSSWKTFQRDEGIYIAKPNPQLPTHIRRW